MGHLVSLFLALAQLAHVVPEPAGFQDTVLESKRHGDVWVRTLKSGVHSADRGREPSPQDSLVTTSGAGPHVGGDRASLGGSVCGPAEA